MLKIKFIWLLLTGTVVPTGEQHEGHKLYHIIQEDGVIENAYKGEILNYIYTGEFEYNEAFEFTAELDEEVFYSKN